MVFRIVFFNFLSLFFLKASLAAVPKVVVSTAPAHSIICAVMDGVGRPELLLPPAVSVHDFHLKPSDLRRLADADLIFWGGPALETGLVRTLNALGKEGRSVAFLSDPRLTVYPAGEDHVHDHARDTDHDHDHEHDHGEIDGHYWLLPDNMAVIADITAEKLSASDPDNAPLYRENARKVKEMTDALTDFGFKRLGNHARKPYVVFHDAYRYFEKKFGLSPLGYLFVDPHHAAGAGRISGTRKKIRRAGTVCLFSEPQFSDKKLKAAAEGLPVVFGKLDPAGTDLLPGKEFYRDLMEKLIRSFAECLDSLPAE